VVFNFYTFFFYIFLSLSLFLFCSSLSSHDNSSPSNDFPIELSEFFGLIEEMIPKIPPDLSSVLAEAIVCLNDNKCDVFIKNEG